MIDLLLILDQIKTWVIGIIATYGGWGIFVGMFFESSIIPIPSEIILVTAGLSGLPLWEIVLFGTVGSVLGSIVGYYIGRCGRPVINKYGKYMLLTDKTLKKAENWIERHGKMAIIITRLIPFLPYKVFSITFGLMRTKFRDFIIYSIIGTIPRVLLLAWIGQQLMAAKLETLLVLGVGVLILYLLWHFKIHHKVKNRISKGELTEHESIK